MTFNKNINSNDFTNFDFGFELIDAPPSESTEEQSTVSSSEFESKIENIENKLGTLLAIVSQMDNGKDDDSLSEMISINDKLDQILSIETNELSQAINDQGASIRAIIDEVEERKEQLNQQYNRKIEEVENLVLPLLINLTKNPEREYIKWPNRAESVQTQIDKILEVTRGNGD